MAHLVKNAMILALALATSSGLARAHHSFAGYNQNRLATVKGTVEVWQWSNPHCFLLLTVSRSDGTQTQYKLLARSTDLLSRQHVQRDTLHTGQIVTATYNPLRDGENGGLLGTVVGEDGKLLINRFQRPGLAGIFDTDPAPAP